MEGEPAQKRLRTTEAGHARITVPVATPPASSGVSAVDVQILSVGAGAGAGASGAALDAAVAAPPKMRHKDAHTHPSVAVAVAHTPHGGMDVSLTNSALAAAAQAAAAAGAHVTAAGAGMARLGGAGGGGPGAGTGAGAGGMGPPPAKKGRRCGVCKDHVFGHNAATCPKRDELAGAAATTTHDDRGGGGGQKKGKRLRRCSACNLMTTHNAATCSQNDSGKKRRRASRTRVGSGHRKAPAHGGDGEKHWPRRSPLARGFTRRCARDGCSSRSIWYCTQCSRAGPGAVVGVEDLVYLCIPCFEEYHTGSRSPDPITAGGRRSVAATRAPTPAAITRSVEVVTTSAAAGAVVSAMAVGPGVSTAVPPAYAAPPQHAQAIHHLGQMATAGQVGAGAHGMMAHHRHAGHHSHARVDGGPHAHLGVEVTSAVAQLQPHGTLAGLGQRQAGRPRDPDREHV